jgi:hypothetical protein
MTGQHGAHYQCGKVAEVACSTLREQMYGRTIGVSVLPLHSAPHEA